MEKLQVPRHFLAKIMKTMVKEGILHSTKGPYGGFSLNEHTLKSKIIQLVKITDGVEQFNNCVLSLRKCKSDNPCPLHYQMLKLRDDMLADDRRRDECARLEPQVVAEATDGERIGVAAVSYTHLTLPTISSVSISVVAVSLIKIYITPFPPTPTHYISTPQ